MKNKKPNRIRDGRSNDFACNWFTHRYGDDWETWRVYADEWLHAQDAALDFRRKAITLFFESYLIGNRLPSDPNVLFHPDAELPDLIRTIKVRIKSNQKIRYNNYIVEFLDWIIAKDYSEPNDYGQLIPLVANPFIKIKENYQYAETVLSPLPYTFIKELRGILCPNPKGHFRDWTWAQQQSGQDKSDRKRIPRFGDWFEVNYRLIDKTDPDCVWRERVLMPGRSKTINGKMKILKKKIFIYEIWSPVRAMLMLIKLHLPLRTHQICMLDSGEADTWRYVQGHWRRNTRHKFAVGNEKYPKQSGVFRRIRSPETGEFCTGIYINTNKTADQNKDAPERGYVIPWQNEEVLYWLEKLRNWQEKYNPIKEPIPWSLLQPKHLGSNKSKQTLKQMGSTCFLFRKANSNEQEDRKKPITTGITRNLWYRLLKNLEDRVFERGQTLKDGSRIQLVKEYDANTLDCNKVATEYPLHSLRVSLITCYAMDGQVPLPILSKLLAGHSRIIMTLYYCKLTPSVMRNKMQEAEAMIDAKEPESLKNFLADADLNQIQNKTVFQDKDSIAAIMVNRNPLGWEHRHIGLCLVGGNNVKSDEKNSLAGCWNGGDLIAVRGSNSFLYTPVAHGPENCVRCRWFITDASYLDVLRAHCNNLSYQAYLAANLALECEQTVEFLEDERAAVMAANLPFTKTAELQKAERRYEKQIVEADEYAKDFLACFTLIHRIISIESKRCEDDDHQKLVAVGKLHDIRQPISLLETNSELFQLSGICADAEIYPDLADELRKTPALEKRSRVLNTALMRDGYQPIFMMMDEKMQLIAGNAMMRAMAQEAHPGDWKIAGIRRVSGIIEAEQSLREFGLLNYGVKALEQFYQKPLKSLNELLNVPKLELVP